MAMKTATNGANSNIATASLNLCGFHIQRVSRLQAEMKILRKKNPVCTEHVQNSFSTLFPEWCHCGTALCENGAVWKFLTQLYGVFGTPGNLERWVKCPGGHVQVTCSTLPSTGGAGTLGATVLLS